MKQTKVILIGVAVSLSSMLWASADVGVVYADRCANCHGVKANGVPKVKEQAGHAAMQANAQGVASQKAANIFGPPLNHLSQEKLLDKLHNLRNTDFDAHNFDSAMRENLKTIERQEGKITDAQMAEYIYNTFGEGAE